MKRFTTDNGSNEDVTLVDNVTGEEYESNFEDIVDLMNDLNEENDLLKNILKDITIQLDANPTLQTCYMTIPINIVIYNELRRRLKEPSFNEELRRFLDD